MCKIDQILYSCTHKHDMGMIPCPDDAYCDQHRKQVVMQSPFLCDSCKIALDEQTRRAASRMVGEGSPVPRGKGGMLAVVGGRMVNS